MLTEQQVLTIRQEIRPKTFASISRDMGVSQAHIGRVVRGHSKSARVEAHFKGILGRDLFEVNGKNPNHSA